MDFSHTSGKVRDIYDISDDKLIIVTTDRISAFDIVLPKPVIGKGKLLNAISLFWFGLTKDIIPNHVISSDLNDMPDYFQKPEFEGRTLLVKKLKMLPFECIVRGYMFGHMWREQGENGEYRLAEKLPQPVFTPSTKAAKDEYITFAEMEKALGTELANKVKDTSLAIYNLCYEYAYNKGIIIADAKFEFGLDENGNLVLADEILTPDSARFWNLAEYKVGVSPKSYDKQYLRDWLEANSVGVKMTPTEFENVPDEVLAKTTELYTTLADKLREECAVFGACLTTEEAVGATYNGLLTLQHRGQEGAGIATLCDGKITCHKDTGHVSEIFVHGLKKLPPSRIAVGHTRYSTTGGNFWENVGPFVTEYLTGRIATAHNGNITNAEELRKHLQQQGLNFYATSDSEVISSLIAYYITQEKTILQGVVKAANALQGAFSLVIAASPDQLIAVRDTNGYRPLCIGRNSFGYAVASESCALETSGFEFVRDILPGEVVIIQNGQLICEGVQLTTPKTSGLCIFEYVYFARPDSVIDGLSVYEARRNMGAILAEEYPVDADIVCGVPDSGLDAAGGYSQASGIPLLPGFVMNRYIGRSFIYPTQSERDSAVRLKLNPLSSNIRGKKIVLVDDSIVRGTTSEKIVRSLRNAGAKEVHMRISSPPFIHTCHYGTDIDNEENLIANKMSIDEIRQKIGADSLGYISIKGLKNACKKCKTSFCTACFTGSGNAHETSR